MSQDEEVTVTLPCVLCGASQQVRTLARRLTSEAKPQTLCVSCCQKLDATAVKVTHKKPDEMPIEFPITFVAGELAYALLTFFPGDEG